MISRPIKSESIVGGTWATVFLKPPVYSHAANSLIARDRVADLDRLVVEVTSEAAALNNDLNVQEERDMPRSNGRSFLA